MTKDAFTIQAHGIKCDAPGCGWNDMTVPFDKDTFHNKPCPRCNASLLTDADYKAIARAETLAALLNSLLRPFSWLLPHRRTTVTIRMDGSGRITVLDRSDTH